MTDTVKPITVKLLPIEAIYIVSAIWREAMTLDEQADKEKKAGFPGIAYGLRGDSLILMQGREKIRKAIK